MSAKNSKKSTKNSTKSKRSTASATATKKKRNTKKSSSTSTISAVANFGPELFRRRKQDIDNLFDFYWGGKERRITGLTIRILAVNALALIFLAVGILYLGEYKKELIVNKLKTFKTEVEMVAAAVSQGSIDEVETTSSFPFAPTKFETQILSGQARQMIKHLSLTMHKRIQLFDQNGELIADSHKLGQGSNTIDILNLESPKQYELKSVQMLVDTAHLITSLLPDKSSLPIYPNIESDHAIDFPNVPTALEGQISMSAWETEKERLFLSAAAPLIHENQVMGAILLTDYGRDVEEAIGQVWADVLKVFSATLILTIIMSIYLSGVIARPLRRLMRAAEAMRTNKDNKAEIPDLSYRHDEIGELSLVLRDMTRALWDRIDTIESFAADVAHELKNPLTSLKSAVETASIVKKKSDQKKLLNIITHDIDRLDRLITDISQASRLDAELARESFRKIDIGKLLHDLVDMHKDPLERKESEEDNIFNNHATFKNINITYKNQTQQTIQIWGLEGRLMQVFQNILGNALSFSPKKTTVSITLSATDKIVKIEISDQGPGIPDKKLKAIFERFYSERPEHEAYGQHSGLGLSICKQIIHAHNGNIVAKNIKRKGEISGACFTVTLNKI